MLWNATAVAAAVRDHDGVLSLGGGAVLDPETRDLLAGLPVVFLEMSVSAAVKRVGLDAPRPLLILNPRQQWKALMEQRRPLYTEVARAIVDTEGRTPEQVARAVTGRIGAEDRMTSSAHRTRPDHRRRRPPDTPTVRGPGRPAAARANSPA